MSMFAYEEYVRRWEDYDRRRKQRNKPLAKKTDPALKSTQVDLNNSIINGTTIDEEVKKRVLIKGLSSLFKVDVLKGPVYTLELLKKLHKEHLGFDPTETEDGSDKAKEEDTETE